MVLYHFCGHLPVGWKMLSPKVASLFWKMTSGEMQRWENLRFIMLKSFIQTPITYPQVAGHTM
jgi:hypothetical protein